MEVQIISVPDYGNSMKLKSYILEQMKHHVEDTYPYEGCGVMLGKNNTVTNILKGTNIRQDRKEDRFLLNPADILIAEKYAKEKGIDILGFYHSHPDHPAKPSQTDLENAWEDYYYAIVSVENGKMSKIGLFRLSDRGNEFIEETISIED